MQAPVPQHPHRPRRPWQRALARRAVLRGATASGLATVLAALAALQPCAPAAAATPGSPTPVATSQAPLMPADLAPLAVRPLAATCASCHGTDGRPADTAMPPLAGLPQDVFTAQMRAFRSGERPATVMHQISRGYTDAQVEALAAYFAGLPR